MTQPEIRCMGPEVTKTTNDKNHKDSLDSLIFSSEMEHCNHWLSICGIYTAARSIFEIPLIRSPNYFPTHTVKSRPSHSPAQILDWYTPGRSRRVITQARGMSVSRLHCTLGFDDRALLLLVGTQTSEFFAAPALLSVLKNHFLESEIPVFPIPCHAGMPENF